MPRLLRLILFLTVISMLLILATRLVGSLRPAMTLSAIMSKPDGTLCDRPCLFGVRPGETSLEQAVTMLHSHPLTHDARWIDDYTLQLIGPAAYVAFNRTREGLIDSISFSDNLNDSGVVAPGSLASSITTGEIILAFGVPHIQLPESPYFVVGFPTVGITAAFAMPKNSMTFVRPSTPVNMIMIAVLRPCPTEGSMFAAQPWIGFTTISRYLKDRRYFAIMQRFSGVPVPPLALCEKYHAPS